VGLYKRGTVWWMALTCSSGKQIRRSTETGDKKLAQKILAKVQTKITEGKWFDRLPGESKKFSELAEKYENGEFKQTKSCQNTQSYLNQLKEFFGEYTLSGITPVVIDEFRSKRRSDGVKPGTIKRQMNIFKAMLNLAKRWQWIAEVPSVGAEKDSDVKRIRHLTFQEYHKLLECCDDWLRDIVVIGAWTGLRQKNALHLTRTQVNLSSKTVLIESAEMKNNDNLGIPMAGPAYVVLKRAMKVSRLGTPYIFCTEDNRPHHKQKVHRHFREALKKAGINDFRFHDLRHCYGTWLADSGADIYTIARLLGHKDIRMATRYTHITTARKTDVVDTMERRYQEFITNLSQGAKEEGAAS